MGTYIGTLGRLMQLRRVRTLDVELWDGRTFQRTLEGRMKVQTKGARNREWSVSMELATPADLANIQAMQDGEFGRGPFVFIPPAAPTTNMLEPDVSTCGPTAVMSSNVSQVGPLLLPDGSWAGRSLKNATPEFGLYFGTATVPVISGSQVTASAYLVGSGSKVGVQFFNAAGMAISSALSISVGVAGTSTRLAVTATVPAMAVACVVYGSNALQGARPALTWTSEAFAWGIGAGCPKAVIHGFSYSLAKVLGKPNGASLFSFSFTAQEVS